MTAGETRPSSAESTPSEIDGETTLDDYRDMYSFLSRRINAETPESPMAEWYTKLRDFAQASYPKFHSEMIDQILTEPHDPDEVVEGNGFEPLLLEVDTLIDADLPRAARRILEEHDLEHLSPDYLDPHAEN